MDNEMSGKRIALIGGAGFIGHNLALRLKAQGADVTVVDGLQVNNFLTFQSIGGASPNRKMYATMTQQRLELLQEAEIPIMIQDARNYHALSRIISETKPDVIVHLAAVSHANRSNKDPYTTFDHSLRTLENALDAARGRLPHFVYFSSSMVYGDFADGEVTEETPCSPKGIYGALKLSGELMVKAYNQVFDLPYTIIRPSALYGERCVSRRVGQIFIENALSGAEIRVDGDGSDRLDFTYIDDLCHGVERVILSPSSRGETFNITYGEGRSLTEMLDILHEHFPDLATESTPRDRLMPKRGTLNVDKARRLIGYEPRYPLERGFRKYIEWYQSAFGDDTPPPMGSEG